MLLFNRNQLMWCSALFFTLLVVLALWQNMSVYHYPGHHFAPRDAFKMCIILLLMSVGLKLQFDGENAWSRCCREVALAIALFTLLFWGAEAIQYTPYPVIDKYLVQGDSACHIHVNAMVAWLEGWPWLKSALAVIYDGLSLELLLLPFLLILFRQYALLYESYTLIFITAIIGYSIYYFFPTVAPATMLGGKGFTAEQFSTGVKFYELHRHVTPSTDAGGLISFPSFHVIWACLLTNMVRCWWPLYIVLLGFNALVIFSCVVLGWHYAVDVVGSVLVLALSYWIDRGLVR